MMSIKHAADRSGLPTKTVRYYADIGLVVPNGRSQAGYRLYDEPEIARLVFVRRARAFGFSVEACRELLSLYGDRERTSAEVKAIASRHLAALNERLCDLRALRDELSLLVEACAGDERPECPILLGLAEAGTPRRQTQPKALS